MALDEKKQTMLTSMFTKISHEKRECVVAKEFDQLKAIAAVKRKIQEKITEKCQVRRLRKNTMLICPSIIKQEEEEQDARRKKSQYLQKKRHSYNMWFVKDLFPPIQEVIKRYGRTQAAIYYLEIAFRTPGGPNPYKKLGRSSLYDWFDEKKELQANYKEAANLEHHPKKQDQNLPILDNYPHVRDQLVSKLQKMREAGQTLLISIVQPILRGMFKALAPQLLDDRPGGFTVSRQWTNEFMKVYMNWTIRKGTTTTSKLSLD